MKQRSIRLGGRKILSFLLALLTLLSTLTVFPLSVFAAGPTALTITPNFGKIENYGPVGLPKQTLLILTMSSAKGTADSKTMYDKLRLGQLTMKLTITDTADGSVQTIEDYYVQSPGFEFVSDTYVRLSVSRYGVELNPAHAYTVKIDVLDLAGEILYSGTSASGAFLSTNPDFLANGTIKHRTYDADEDSPLYGKTAMFIGDSLTEAICEVKVPYYSVTAGWPGRVAAQNGMRFINTGVSGESISKVKTQILTQLQANVGRPVDYIVVGGGANDAWFNAPIGKVTGDSVKTGGSFDQSTFAGGLEYLFWYAKENFPGAKIVYIMNSKVLGHWYGDTNILGYLDDMTGLFAEAKKVCEKWDVPYLDLYNNDTVSERMQYTTTYAMADYIHPNDKGYDILAPYISQFLCAVAEGADQQAIDALPDPPYTAPADEITEADVDVAFGKSAVNSSGTSIPEATDGNWRSAAVFGTRVEGAAVEDQPYLEVDLGWYYDLTKLRISNYGPCMNLLYQYRIYAADDNTKPLSQWTQVGENEHNIASGEGLIYTFEPVNARYLRLYPMGADGESTYYISSLQAYGTPSEDDPTTDKKPENVSDGKPVTTWDGNTTGILTDGKTDAVYSTEVGNQSYTILDLGSEKTVGAVSVITYESDSSFGVYGSKDNTTWTKLGVKEAEEAVTEFTTPGGSYRYIKILGLRNRVSFGGLYVVIRQITVYDENGEKIPVASYTEQNISVTGWTTKNAIDGNADDGNYLGLKEPTSYLTLDLEKLSDLRDITLYPEDPALPFTVSVSADGTSYTSYAKYPGNGAPGEAVVFRGIAKAQYVRVTPDLSAAPDSFGLYEIAVRAILPDSVTPGGNTENGLLSDGAMAETSENGQTGLLTDGDKTENCLSLPSTPSGSVTLDLGGDKAISRVVAYTRWDDQNSYGLYASTDGRIWTTLGIKELSAEKSYEVAVEGSYRYIRLVHLIGRTNADRYVGVTELEVYAADGTTNLALDAGVTASAQNAYNNNVSAKYVKDGILDTTISCCWLYPAKHAYAVLDLAVAAPVNAVTVYPKDAESAAYTVSTSLDGEIFTEFGSIAPVPAESYDGKGLTVTGSAAARYVKIEYTGDETTMDLYEVEVKTTLSGEEFLEMEITSQITTPVTDGSGKNCPFANDGNFSGAYTLVPEGENCYVIIDLENEYELSKICVQMYNEKYTYSVYGSNDRLEWTHIADSKVDKSLNETPLSGSYRYLKLVGTTCFNAYFTFYEVDVYGKLYGRDSEIDPFDLNGDETVNIQDVTVLLSHLADVKEAFAPGRDGDLTGDGIVNIKDVSRLLLYLAA